MSAEKAIEIEGLAIGYARRGMCRVVAENMTATLCRGEVVALAGRNGAGKSTLLATLAGYSRPLSGHIRYMQSSAAEMTRSMLARMVAVVSTESPKNLNLTVRELVALGRTPYTDFTGRLRARDNEAVENAMATIRITHLRDRQVGELSDGERQKCMIAKALAQDTPVIMLDEPTAYLDFQSKVALFRMLRVLAEKEKKAVLLSSHDLELLLRMADKLWLLDKGALHCGTVDELADNGILEAFVKDEGMRYMKESRTLEILEAV